MGYSPWGCEGVGHDLAAEQRQLSLIRCVHDSELTSIKLSTLYRWT